TRPPTPRVPSTPLFRSDYPQALLGLADLCVTLGDIPAAKAHFRRAIARGIEVPLALAGLSTCERLEAGSEEAVAILEHLKAPGRSEEHTSELQSQSNHG